MNIIETLFKWHYAFRKRVLDKKLDALEDLVNIDGADNEMSRMSMKIHHFENQKKQIPILSLCQIC